MTTSPAVPTRLFARSYSIVVVATFGFFAAFGMSLPILPRYVVDVLGQGDVVVGLVFGAYAVSAVLVRPLIGRIGDVHGRRWLVLGGSLVTAIGLFGHLLADSVTILVMMRLLAGAGQAAVVVGFATMALDLAPTERQGEASSYVMVAVQLGIGAGPMLGELLLRAGSYDAVWVASGVGALLSLLAAGFLPADVRRRVVGRSGLFHPAGVRPGVIMGLGAIGFVGWLAFVPLYGDQIGLEQVAPVFLVCSGTVALVRTLGARLPDRIGAVTGATVALSLMAVGFVAMGVLRTPTGLYLTTIVMASGSALLAPSMVLAAIRGVEPQERARVMATYTMFMDIASAVGPSLLGLVAAVGGYGATFVTTGVIAAVGLVLLRTWLAPRLALAPTGRVSPAPST